MPARSLFFGILLVCGFSFAENHETDFYSSARSSQLDGIWQARGEFNFVTPFPYLNYSTEYWTVSDSSLNRIVVIGEQNESRKFQLKIEGNTLSIFADDRLYRKFQLEIRDSDNLTLCSEISCRDFSRISEVPKLMSGYHETPQIQIYWSWDINGSSSEYNMPIQLLQDTYNTLGIRGVDFSREAESGFVYHATVFNYLLKKDFLDLSSYGFTFYLSGVHPMSKRAKFIEGTKADPFFFEIGKTYTLEADRNGDHIRFQIRFEHP